MAEQQVIGNYNYVIDSRRDLTRTLSEAVTHWGGPSGLGLARTGYHRARAGLELLDDALARLGDRDRNNIKSALTLQRDEIARAIEAIESLIGDREILVGLEYASALVSKRLTGPLFVELLQTIDLAAAERRAADDQMHRAVGVDLVRAAREAIDVASAGQRHASRQIDLVLNAIAFPELPDAKIFELARTNTEALLRLGASKPSARAMHGALDAGLAASPAEAKLWVCWESDEPHKLVDLRWLAYSERG